MNAMIETHWSRILYCDVFAAGMQMPHPSEIAGGGLRHPGGGRYPGTRGAAPSTTPLSKSRGSHLQEER